MLVPCGSDFAGLQVERGRIDAIAQTGRFRAIGEHMPQVGVAASAPDLDPVHAMTEVIQAGDGRIAYRLEIAGPATAESNLASASNSGASQQTQW